MDLTTQSSLLARLGSESSDRDWQTFYDKYAAVIVSFGQKQGLDSHAARDVLQETMLVLMRKLPTFHYEPERGRFRNWLLGIVSLSVRESRRRGQRAGCVSFDAAGEDGEALENLPSQEPMPGGETLEAAWRESLLETALARLLEDPHTKPESVAVFRACALDGRPVAEVAAEYGLQENAVYQIKSRLQRRLRELLLALEAGEPGAVNSAHPNV